MATFTYYTDPGHGWVKVPKSLLVKLEIDSQITLFSYTRGDSVYLEEDCDLSTFEHAYRATGKELNFRHNHTNRQSKIRSYNQYYWHLNQ